MATTGGRDPKAEALKADRSLNERPEAVRDEEFGRSEFFDARDLVQVKYEMVRRVRVDGATVSAAAAAFGFSRPSYYQAAAALDEGGLAGLARGRPGPHGAHKLTDEVVAHALAMRAEDPQVRPGEIVAAIETRFGVRVHPRSVERALARRRAAEAAPRQAARGQAASERTGTADGQASPNAPKSRRRDAGQRGRRR